MGSDYSIDADYVAGGALRWQVPIDGLRLAGSYRTAEADVSSTVSAAFLPGGTGSYYADVTENSVWVASAEYSRMNLTLTTEYTENKIRNINGIVGMGPGTEGKLHSSGWYAQATWRFNEWCAAGIYYSEFYPEKDDKEGETQVARGNPDYYAWQKEIVPSIRFDVGYNFIVKAEVHFIDGAGQVYSFNNPEGREKDWNLYVLKASFNF